MIISHKHRYLFVELYQTASTAISSELRASYDGEPILKKHSFYEEFLRVASPRERGYFVFSGIRNPLEIVTSMYFKYKANQNDFENPKHWSSNGGWITPRLLRHYRFVTQEGTDFSDFLRKFYWFPYDNWSRLSHSKMDFIIRFENIDTDFDECLRRIGLEVRRPLPRVNATVGKPRDVSALFDEDAVRLALRSFGPFMTKWGYHFPPEWGAAQGIAPPRNIFPRDGVLWRRLPTRVHGIRRRSSQKLD